jgi:hypothetical protein
MQISLPTANILKTQFETLLYESRLTELLSNGNLYDFENLLHQKISDLYDKISEVFFRLVSLSPDFVNRQKLLAKEEGLKKLEFRDTNVRLRTGTKVNFPSLYAKVAPKDYEGSRLLSSALWSISMNCSPMYKSINCLYSVLCPSFEVSKELLNYQNIDANFEKVRQASLDLAEECISERTTVQLEEGESLFGKRVVIAMDGGRSRTRVYEEGKLGRGEKFATPWREPKMFVITTIDEEGKLDKRTKPIYDNTFGDDQTFELLGSYLKELEVEKAESVQFLADGAVWIWNRVKPLLLSLGVEENKIIETLDYYHAIEHVNEMKVYFDKDKQNSHFEPLKDALWRGDFEAMTRLIQQGISGVNLKEFTPFKYFEKQKNRIDYQSLRDANRLCGSGIIESGIRRIINLRFKSPSTFWYPKNVEKLIYMRGVALSGRWQIMMNNKFRNM